MILDREFITLVSLMPRQSRSRTMEVRRALIGPGLWPGPAVRPAGSAEVAGDRVGGDPAPYPIVHLHDLRHTGNQLTADAGPTSVS
jgi:hypothetical protein